MVITGNPVPIEKLKGIRENPSGREVDIEVEGAKPYVLEVLHYYATGAKSCEYEADGAVGRIHATYAGPPAGVTEVPQDRISLKTNEVQQSLFLNDRYIGIPKSIIKVIRDQIAKQDGTATAYRDATGEITAACLFANGFSNLGPLELFDSLLAQNDSFVLFARAIMRTRTVSPRFDTKVSQTDVGALFTAEQLSTALSGSTLPFQVPTMTLTADDVTQGRIVAWLKTQCDVDDTAGGQRQLTESWRMAKYLPGVYPVKV
jgi:hypothetical protein